MFTNQPIGVTKSFSVMGIDEGEKYHCVKRVRIWSFSSLYFPAFSPSARKYGPEKLQMTMYHYQIKFMKSSIHYIHFFFISGTLI